MNDFFSFVKEILDEVAVAYRYAELDFYKLKTEVLSLISNASNKGYYSNPDFCSLSIHIENRFETDVIIEAYYNKGNGKYQRFKKTLDLGTLTNIPDIVKSRLQKDGGDIQIKLTDLDKLRSVQEKDITPTVEFRKLYEFYIKDAKGVPVRKELHITDELFYYTVAVAYVYEDETKDIRVKRYGKILNLPNEVIEKIASNEENSCYIDVTKSQK